MLRKQNPYYLVISAFLSQRDPSVSGISPLTPAHPRYYCPGPSGGGPRGAGGASSAAPPRGHASLSVSAVAWSPSHPEVFYAAYQTVRWEGLCTILKY